MWVPLTHPHLIRRWRRWQCAGITGLLLLQLWAKAAASAAWGNGFEKIEMQFLSDLYVTCPECEGKRYQPHALKVLLNGKSIHDVLSMTIDEACRLVQPGAAQGLKTQSKRNQVAATPCSIEAGLGYLKLGQPLNTLSRW
jgi:excinuclease ABC subunit A